MKKFRAQVRDKRIYLDEKTDTPDGTVVLVPEDVLDKIADGMTLARFMNAGLGSDAAVRAVMIARSLIYGTKDLEEHDTL